MRVDVPVLRPPQWSTVAGQPRNVSVRLTVDGVLEVDVGGGFGPVCDDGFGGSEADAVCRAMGFRAHAWYDSTSGSTDVFAMDEVNCAVDCTYESAEDCDADETVTLKCTNTTTVGVRAGENVCSFTAGDGSGGTEAGVGDADSAQECAAMVMRQEPGANGATYSNTGGTDCFAEFGMTGPSDSNSWQTCLFGGGDGYATQPEGTAPSAQEQASDDGAQMMMAGTSRSVRVRIRESGSRGTLQVNIDGGGWGQVCDDSFDQNAVTAFCRDLGFSGGVQFDTTHGDGTFAADDIICPEGSNSASQCTGQGSAQGDASRDAETFSI
eukprot:COSAG04_NODE_6214_length_1383_cov_0.771028_1_plen_323_part_01